jgi:chromate transporter
MLRGSGTTPAVAAPARFLRAFLKLGLTSFGGPMAHLGYYHNKFFERSEWLDEAAPF